ncbi:MAG: glycosyltransferase family 39 protein [Myxococcota bacterium]
MIHYATGVLVAEFGTGVLGQWAPLYDAWLGAIFRLAGPVPWWPKALQVALSPVAVACSYGLALRAGGVRAARLAAFAVALDPTLAAFSHYLYTESVFVTLLLPACWLLFHRAEGPSRTDLVLGGLLFGLSVLTRSVALYFLFAWPVWAWLRGRRERAAQAALVLAVALAVVLPWSIRNVAKYDAFLLVDGTIGRTAWFAFSEAYFSRDLGYLGRHQELPARAPCPADPAPGAPDLPPTDALVALFPEGWHGLLGRRPPELPLGRTRDFAVRDLARSGRCEIANALAFAREQPLVVAGHMAHRVQGFWAPNSYLLRWVRHGFYGEGPLARDAYPWVKGGVVALHLVFCVAALLAFGRRRLHPFLLWSAAFVGYYTCMHVLSVAHSRYRLPVMPFVMIAASCWLADPRLPEGPARRTGIGLAVAGFLALCGHYLVTRLP